MSFFKKLFGQKEGDGETPEFKALLEGSMEGLVIQTQAHQGSWQLGKSERWDFSLDTGELVFTFPDLIVRAPAQIIGTFDSPENSWMWGWANPSLAESLTQDSVRVRDYGQKHQIRLLTTPTWTGQETDAWQMAALANRLCETNGVYRGPAGTTHVFFTSGRSRLPGGHDSTQPADGADLSRLLSFRRRDSPHESASARLSTLAVILYAHALLQIRNIIPRPFAASVL